MLEVETEESFPCPKCGGIVHNDFRNCPYCKHVLRNICGACGQELKLDWQMCPYCSHAVRAESGLVTSNGQLKNPPSKVRNFCLSKVRSS